MLGRVLDVVKIVRLLGKHLPGSTPSLVRHGSILVFLIGIVHHQTERKPRSDLTQIFAGDQAANRTRQFCRGGPKALYG
jgi:hypothetical protein